jgi:hypothetical protein
MFFVVFYSFCVLIDLNKYEFRGKKVEPFGYEGALFDHKIGPFFLFLSLLLDFFEIFDRGQIGKGSLVLNRVSLLLLSHLILNFIVIICWLLQSWVNR